MTRVRIIPPKKLQPSNPLEAGAGTIVEEITGVVLLLSVVEVELLSVVVWTEEDDEEVELGVVMGVAIVVVTLTVVVFPSPVVKFSVVVSLLETAFGSWLSSGVIVVTTSPLDWLGSSFSSTLSSLSSLSRGGIFVWSFVSSFESGTLERLPGVLVKESSLP